MMDGKINIKQIVLWGREESQIINKFREFGAIPNEDEVKCQTCDKAMHLWFSQTEKQWFWRCNRKYRLPHKKETSCNNKKSIKKLSIFEGTHLDFEQIMIVIHEWTYYSEIGKMSLEANIGSSRTATLWNKFCTEVVINSCILNSTPIGK